MKPVNVVALAGSFSNAIRQHKPNINTVLTAKIPQPLIANQIIPIERQEQRIPGRQRLDAIFCFSVAGIVARTAACNSMSFDCCDSDADHPDAMPHVLAANPG